MTKRDTLTRTTQLLGERLSKENGEPIGVICIAVAANMNYAMASNVDDAFMKRILRAIHAQTQRDAQEAPAAQEPKADKPGCGRGTTMGHGDTAICGEPYYGSVWQCGACAKDELAKLHERLAREAEGAPNEKPVAEDGATAGA